MKKQIPHMKSLLMLGLFMIFSVQLFAQTITGTVTDQQGNPMPGVNVVVQGTSQGTVTNPDGKYQLEVTEDADALNFSFVGYEPLTEPINGRTTINVTLMVSTQSLDDVVVVGYGSQNKDDLTGAVKKISDEDFESANATNPDQLMQGKISGVNITQASGEPGAAANVRIRGASSVRSGNQPLYVVDGIPLSNNTTMPSTGSKGGGVGAAQATNPLNFLNPNDIESINVLKDASATAIYGARGANGVIIITTKEGEAGKTQINYSGSFSVSNVANMIDLLDADQFMAAQKEVQDFYNTDANADNDISDADLQKMDYGANTNWQEEIYRTAISQRHNVSLSGGSENTTFHASMGYQDQEGVVKTSGLEKINGKLNGSVTGIDDKLKISTNLSFANINQSRAPIGETNGAEGDAINNALGLNPTLPVYNDDGTYFQLDPNNRNPLAMVNLMDDNTETNRILGNVTGSFEILEGLTFKTKLGLDYSDAVRRTQANTRLVFITQGSAGIYSLEIQNQLMENFLTYKKKFGSHSLNLLAGYSYQSVETKAFETGKRDFPFNAIPFVNNLEAGRVNAEPASSVEKAELQSFFGRVNYKLMQKYLVTATLRRDGSSRFGQNNKYGNFPSFSFAWRLYEEDFIKNLGIFDMLKLRLGWGITGNQEFANKVSQTSLGTNPAYKYYIDGVNVQPGLAYNRTPNPDIKWEETTQTNIGLDFGFFDGRLTGNIDYFNKVTRDMLLQVSSLPPAPVSTVWQNVDGELTNSGIEGSLEAVVIDNKDLSWNISGNFTTVNNEISGIPNEIRTGAASGQGLSNVFVQTIQNGLPLGTFFGKKFTGFDENGRSTFKDADGDGTPEADYTFGSALPDYSFGINSNLKYKNFNLSITVNSQQGNVIFNNTALAMFQKSALVNQKNISEKAFNTEQAYDDALTVSDRYFVDGSFVRLSNVHLGYTFNEIKVQGIKSIRLFANGSNLLLFTGYNGYDPEVNTDASEGGVPSIGIDNTNYPRPRTFQFGLNVQFD